MCARWAVSSSRTRPIETAARLTPYGHHGTTQQEFSVSRTRLIAAAMLAALAPFPAVAQDAHHVTLHVNPRWKECAIQLDRSLTQGAWRQFTREAGLVTYFRPLTDARPMGKGKYEISLLQWQTGIDDETAAWNDTFVHPTADHWLFEGSGLGFPGLTARVGITDRIDAGVYFTKNTQSNYGVYAAQLQVNLLNDRATGWAAATRVNYASLFGPDDLTHATVGVDGLVSKTYVANRWLTLSPYAGATAYLSRAHETSPVVNLKDEQVGGLQGMAGVVAQVKALRISAEFNTAKVNTTAVKIGVAF
jgi:hypothetical protein